MDYLSTFYPQSVAFEASFNFKSPGPSSVARFGLSGNKTGVGRSLVCSVSGNEVRVNGKFCSSLNEKESVAFNICGDNTELSVWQNGNLIDHVHSGFSFDKMFASYSEGEEFNAKIAISKPNLGYSISPWDNAAKTGHLRLYNNGKDTVSVTSLDIFNIFLKPTFTGAVIPTGQSVVIPLYHDKNSSFSGLGRVVLETNAGGYSFDADFLCTTNNNFSNIVVSFEKNIFYPSGNSNFFIRNFGNQDKEVELFFDYFEKQAPSIKTGSCSYFKSGVGIINYNYTGGGYFRKVNGACGFTQYVNEIIDGVKTFTVQYTGNFTGTGGRLNATGTQTLSGFANYSIYTTGQLVYNYSIPVSSIVLGNTAYANWTGALTGIINTGSGQFYFLQNITTTGVLTARLGNGTVIYPPSGTVFSGSVNSYVTLRALVSGNQPYYISQEIDIYEGSGHHLDFWAVDINDYDRGYENFISSGRITNSGFGISGIKYRIPSGQTATGQVRYFSNYGNPLFQSLICRVTDYSSLNRDLYINVQ